MTMSFGFGQLVSTNFTVSVPPTTPLVELPNKVPHVVFEYTNRS